MFILAGKWRKMITVSKSTSEEWVIFYSIVHRGTPIWKWQGSFFLSFFLFCFVCFVFLFIYLFFYTYFPLYWPRKFTSIIEYSVDQFQVELTRARRTQRSTTGTKMWSSTLRENLVITWPYARPSVCTTGIPMLNNPINRYGNSNATGGYFGGKSHSHPRLVRQTQLKSQ